jgi:hypothetical protein
MRQKRKMVSSAGEMFHRAAATKHAGKDRVSLGSPEAVRRTEDPGASRPDQERSQWDHQDFTRALRFSAQEKPKSWSGRSNLGRFDCAPAIETETRGITGRKLT